MFRIEFPGTDRREPKSVSTQSAESYSCTLLCAPYLGTPAAEIGLSMRAAQDSETEARLCAGRVEQKVPGLRLSCVSPGRSME